MKNKTTKNRRKTKVRYLKALLLPLFAFIVSAATAQEAIPVSGGEASGENGSLSYSIGQMIYKAVDGSSGNLSAGVQQPYEIQVVTGVNDLPGILLNVSAYPNPATDYLILNTGASGIDDFRNLEYRLSDMNGRLLHSQGISGYETTIAMGHLLPALYFVKVISGNKEIKTFKIIKK
jgi:hypothetical protein